MCNIFAVISNLLSIDVLNMFKYHVEISIRALLAGKPVKLTSYLFKVTQLEY
jgi:hypothetical protein